MEINRNKWERCEKCRYEKEDMLIYYPCDIDTVVGFETGWAQYCPECGRPLTEEGWEKLERKVYGE